MKRNIGVVTTSRADYGIYVPVLKRIQASSNLSLSLYVTGMHLVKEWGNTVDEIVKDGFPIAAQIPTLRSADAPVDIVRSMGQATIGFGQLFDEQRPDCVVVLGDRFEMHASAIAAIPFRLPIIHIHGGELTFGSFDELFRHSLTKMSHLHCASTPEYAQRIIQMGEEPWRVIVSGAPALDQLPTTNYSSRQELESEFHIDLSRPTLLVTFHPVTVDYQRTDEYVDALTSALSLFPGMNVIFTYPNADTYREHVIEKIEQYVQAHQNAFVVKNFGQRGYFSVMKYVQAMVGNSSSGILEAASFELPVVNIGTREQGRLRNANVIDVGYTAAEIRNGIERAIASSFKESLRGIQNRYGDGRASERIVALLETVDLELAMYKQFYDLPK